MVFFGGGCLQCSFRICKQRPWSLLAKTKATPKERRKRGRDKLSRTENAICRRQNVQDRLYDNRTAFPPDSVHTVSKGRAVQTLDGAAIAKNARIELEQKTGKKVVTPLNARDGIGLTEGTKSSVFLEDEERK